MPVDEELLKRFDFWYSETERIDSLYEGLKPSEIRELVRQYCEALIGNLSISDIMRMGEDSNYDHMFHIDLDNLPENDKGYEVDIVLDYKHDQIYQEEMKK